MKTVLSLIVVFSFFSCRQNAKVGCDSDAECRQGRICTDRVCGELLESAEPLNPDSKDECETNLDCSEGIACAKNAMGAFSCVPADLVSGTGELRDNDCYFFWEFELLSDDRAKMDCAREVGDSYTCTCSYVSEDVTLQGEATLPAVQTCEFLAAEDFMNHYCGTKLHGSFGVYAQMYE